MKRLAFALIFLVTLVSCGKKTPEFNENLNSPSRKIATLGEITSYIEGGELRGVEIAGEAPDNIAAVTSDGKEFILLCGGGVQKYRLATLEPGGEVDFETLADCELAIVPDLTGSLLVPSSPFTLAANERFIVVASEMGYYPTYVLDRESGELAERLINAYSYAITLDCLVRCDGRKILALPLEDFADGDWQVVYDGTSDFAGYGDFGMGLIQLLTVDADGRIYFGAKSSEGWELWRYDEAPEKLLTHPSELTSAQFNGELYFADETSVYRLDKGSATKLADLPAPIPNGINRAGFTVLGGQLYCDLGDFASGIAVH